MSCDFSFQILSFRNGVFSYGFWDYSGNFCGTFFSHFLDHRCLWGRFFGCGFGDIVFFARIFPLSQKHSPIFFLSFLLCAIASFRDLPWAITDHSPTRDRAIGIGNSEINSIGDIYCALYLMGGFAKVLATVTLPRLR